jgi:hypothetical protein
VGLYAVDPHVERQHRRSATGRGDRPSGGRGRRQTGLFAIVSTNAISTRVNRVVAVATTRRLPETARHEAQISARTCLFTVDIPASLVI